MADLEQVADYLERQQLTVVTAESCTAGLAAGALADIPGCGTWFKSGYITYSPGAKHAILGVRFETIERFNLTSEEVAREMAEGVLRISDARVAISNTGVAGPGNGDGGIPAGTVCFAWGFRHGGQVMVFSETMHFEGDRNAVRQAAAHHALERIPHWHRQLPQGAKA
ncbi:MAG: CinA family protein [Noviherbaspirillum sp.]